MAASAAPPRCGYFRVWASEYSLAALGQRTVVEAGRRPCKDHLARVWAARTAGARPLGGLRD